MGNEERLFLSLLSLLNPTSLAPLTEQNTVLKRFKMAFSELLKTTSHGMYLVREPKPPDPDVEQRLMIRFQTTWDTPAMGYS